MFSHPLRVAIGTFEISGFVQTFADAFASLGHEVTTAMRQGDVHFQESEYDLDISEDVARVPWSTFAARLQSRVAAPRTLRRGLSAAERLHWLVARHDLFVFVYGSLYPDRFCRPSRMGLGREFSLLRRLGKRIVCCFVGPEVRHAAAFDQQLRRHRPERPGLAAAVPGWGRNGLSRPLENLRRAELHADVLLSQPNQAGLALRPYHHLFCPLRLDRIRPRIPGRERPRVVHAPSWRQVKGTREILAALERLRRRGVDFELRLLEGAQNHEVLREMADADVVVDQLHLPLHGRLGVEAMAAGCALATCNDEELEPFPARRPIWHLDAPAVEAQLRALLVDRPLRLRLAERGLRYSRRWHDHREVARRVLAALTGQVRPDHAPEFFARRFELPAGTALPARVRALTAAVARRQRLPQGSLRARRLA